MYDYIIITHLPAFYKVNLYNELAKKLNIYVIFIANNTADKRAKDFTQTHNNMQFQYKILYDGTFQSRPKIQNIFTLYHFLKTLQYKKLLVNGWDLPEFWFVTWLSAKCKNCLALESTIVESNVTGIKRCIKTFFLSRISTVFASGHLHVALLNKLNYHGLIKMTKGVGIINKPIFDKHIREYQKRFLFVGRLSYEKNLKIVINIFNTLPQYHLTIVGEGVQKDELKARAKENIVFLGSVENKELKNVFAQNNIFILPSIIEPWGLVAEEALFFGLPVIVSKNCGVCELIEDGKYGLHVNPVDEQEMKETILKIDDTLYKKLLTNVNVFSFTEKDLWQVEQYCSSHT
jgi:glycosyltransferase involved in cell wall biosynthesis